MNRLISAGICGFLLPCFLAMAEEPAPHPPLRHPPKSAPKLPPPPPPKDKDDGEDDALALKKENRYKLPENADADALIDFCQSLQDFEPEDDAEAKIHEEKLPKAIKRACRKILELEKDKESDNARFARRNLLAIRLDTCTTLDSTKTDKLLEKVRAFLTSPKVVLEDVDVAEALADFLGEHPSPKAAEWSQKIGDLLATHAIPELADAGHVLLGTAKRLNLIGKPLNLKGTTIDGKPFDLTQLKNKTVLIDFWATWCVHCVEDIPALKKCYEDYHAKGFEVVAISADEDRSELVEFLKSEQIPWINIYDNGGKHPAMAEFGIQAFPSTLLVGKDGKVIALNLKDVTLTEALVKEYGVVEGAKDAPAPPPPAASKKESAEDGEDSTESIEKLKKKYSF